MDLRKETDALEELSAERHKMEKEIQRLVKAGVITEDQGQAVTKNHHAMEEELIKEMKRLRKKAEALGIPPEETTKILKSV